MKELFDERLSQKMRQTFDKHEEPYNAQGWEMMKQQMQADKSGKMRTLLTSFPVKAAAAAILVLGGVFTYKTLNNGFDYQNRSQQQAGIAVKKQRPQQEGLEGVQVLPPSADGTHQSDKVANAQKTKKSFTTSTITQSTPMIANRGTKTTVVTGVDKGLIEETEKNKNIYVKETIVANKKTTPKATIIKPEEGIVVKYNINALAMNEPGLSTAKSTSGVSAIEDASFQAVTSSKVAEYKKATAPRRKAVNLGLVLSSLVNYSDKGEKDSKVNMGGGLLSEIAIGKRLSITSGVLLTKQSLQMNEPASLPTLATTLSPGKNGVIQSNSQEQKRTLNMQLIGLDIPINVQYHLSKNTNKGLYVSMGLSSLAYLQEDYTHTTRETITRKYYGTSVQPNTVDTYVTETNAKSNPESLSRFDFAKMLNVSMGMKYVVANNMQILIEPYIKYPLGSLTNEELKFGSAGVNLRCSFNGVRRH